MPEYPRSPFEKTGSSITPNVDGDILNATVMGETTPAAGSFTTLKASDVVTLEKELIIKEITTPTPVDGYGKVYTKTNNRLYFQDGAGIEHLISNEVYGEGWFYDNAVALTVETVDIPIAMQGPIVGELSDMTFNSGSTGVTSVFADGTGGTVLVTSAGHGLSNGAIITIMGSTSYNGVFEVSSVTTDTFKITDTWVADDGVATWIEPTSLLVNTAGIYHGDAHISASVDGICTLIWMPYSGTTPIPKATTERKFPNNDIGSSAMSILIELSVGDILWMSVQSTSLVDITSKHGGMRYHKL